MKGRGDIGREGGSCRSEYREVGKIFDHLESVRTDPWRHYYTAAYVYVETGSEAGQGAYL